MFAQAKASALTGLGNFFRDRARWLLRPAAALLALNLLACGWLPSLFANDATRVRALLLIDTEAENLEACTPIDGQNMQRLLQQAFADRPHQLTLDVLSGTNATPENVLNYYNNLATGESESLLFFYTGHGAIDTATGQHFLAMRHGSMWRHQIRSAMESKGAQLNVLLTNCCSSYAEASALVTSDGAPESQLAPYAPDWTVLNQLLLQQRGTVDITAAEPGTFGWLNSEIGGYFTSALIEKLTSNVAYVDVNRDGFVAWNEFFVHVRQGTEARFQSCKSQAGPADLIQQSANQSPYAFSLPGEQFVPHPAPMRHYVKTVKLANATAEPLRVAIRYLGQNEKGEWVFFPAGGTEWLYYDLQPGADIFPYFGAHPVNAHRIQFAAQDARGGSVPVQEFQLTPQEGYESNFVQSIRIRVNP